MNQEIRLQNLLPRVYTDESRDFQILCRAADVVFNGVKADCDSLLNNLTLDTCNLEILQLLAEKMGLYEHSDLSEEELRCVVQILPYLRKHKGSKEALLACLNCFCKLNHSERPVVLTLITSQTSLDLAGNSFEIQLGLNQSYENLYLLKLLLKYAVPYGYVVKFYSSTDIIYSTSLTPNDSASTQMRYARITSGSDIGEIDYEEVTNTDGTLSTNVTYTSGTYQSFVFTGDADTGNISVEEVTPVSIRQQYEFTIDDDGTVNFVTDD